MRTSGALSERDRAFEPLSPAEQKQFSKSAETAFFSRFTLNIMVDAYMHIYRDTKLKQSL